MPMSVYVDNMNAKYRRMRMFHMLADTREELIDMAKKIDVKTKWIQCEGTYREHFDICKSKRQLALDNGAIEVSMREVALLLNKRKNEIAYSQGDRIE